MHVVSQKRAEPLKVLDQGINEKLRIATNNALLKANRIVEVTI
jgi:hypothetical protein